MNCNNFADPLIFHLRTPLGQNECFGLSVGYLQNDTPISFNCTLCYHANVLNYSSEHDQICLPNTERLAFGLVGLCVLAEPSQSISDSCTQIARYVD